MADHLFVSNSTNVISSWSTACGAMDGHRCVDVDAQDITGDIVPESRKEMTRGILLRDFIYTKPEAIPEDSLITAFKALDPTAETGALKTVIEFLQR